MRIAVVFAVLSSTSGVDVLFVAAVSANGEKQQIVARFMASCSRGVEAANA